MLDVMDFSKPIPSKGQFDFNLCTYLVLIADGYTNYL
jgi:hypothetical protein